MQQLCNHDTANHSNSDLLRTGTQTISVAATWAGLTYSWRRAGTAVTKYAISVANFDTYPYKMQLQPMQVMMSLVVTVFGVTSAATVTVNAAPRNHDTANHSNSDLFRNRNANIRSRYGSGLTYSWWRRAGTAVTKWRGLVSGQGTSNTTLQMQFSQPMQEGDVIVVLVIRQYIKCCNGSQM
jgi:hypothetical protein